MISERFAFGPFVLDLRRGALTRDGQPVGVGHKGLLLLRALVSAPGEIIDKTRLMDAAWPGAAVEESNLSVQIAALRKLLGTGPDGSPWIATVARVGYRFTVTASPPPLQQTNNVQPSRPSIAVLPFKSTGEAQEYLADGLTEDIITALARYRWFRVIARHSSFAFRDRPDVRQTANALGANYLLLGSVRREAQRLRISAQLANSSDGSQVWAQRYDLEMADVFAIQDEIAERVVGAIEPEILRTESDAASRHTGNVTAWDLVRQGMWHFHKVSREGHFAARDLFRRACTIDPDLPEAHIWLGRVSGGIIGYGWSAAPEADGQEGVQAAARAIALDPRDPYAHYAFAIANAYGGSMASALAAAETVVALSSSFALGHLVLGMARLFAVRPREAIRPLEHGLTLNPNDPQNVVWFNLLAQAHLLEGNPAGAVAIAGRALAVRPMFRATHEALVCAHLELGDLEEARRIAAQLSTTEGANHFLAPLWRSDPGWAARVAEMLRRASA